MGNTEKKGRRGYTKFGYPIAWLRKFTHEECLQKLEGGDVKPSGAVSAKVLSSKDDEKGVTFELGGVGFKIQVQERSYTLHVAGFSEPKYISTFSSLLTSLRESIIKAKLAEAKDGKAFLDTLLGVEGEVASLLKNWQPDQKTLNLIKSV